MSKISPNKSKNPLKVPIGDIQLTLEHFRNILYDGLDIELTEGGLARVNKSFDFLKEFSKDKIIYGINTGFGPMAQYKVSDTNQLKLQYNLIRSHSCGSGLPIAKTCVLALMIARLNTIMIGKSGTNESVVHLLVEMINHKVTPIIYEHGGVGASGDLVQLAHLALSLIGEGEVDYQGITRPTAEVFEELNLKPIKIEIREGLSILNGTSAMTGIGIINIIRAENLLQWSLLASCVITEIVESYDDHFSKELNQVKLHKGQRRIAKAMRKVMDASSLIRGRTEHLYKGKNQEKVFREKVQEYYSLRCVPQILGPILETLKNAEDVLIKEVNSANDNPIIDVATQNVYHGGNFHGDYVALEMDKLKIAITKLSMLAERQLNYLLNDKLNNKLPPFVNLGKLGFNFGMQGAQFTATSTVAENQALSTPMYIHSIPNNNDNQDIVSMGANAALMTRKVVENSYEVLAIEWITIIQAIEYLKLEDRLSEISGRTYRALRRLVPKFVEDTPKYQSIRAVKSYLIDTHLELVN